MSAGSRPKLNAILFAMMLRELQAGPCSASDMEVVTGIRRKTTLRWMQTLHRKEVLHIVEWERDDAGRWRTPIYALGHGADVRKPPPMTRAEKYARLIQRSAQTAPAAMGAA